MRFQRSEGDPVETSLSLPIGEEGQWRYFPSFISIKSGGCYGLQVDGANLSETIIFEATS